MYDYLRPLLRKKTEYVILHVSTNDCVNLSSKKVMQDLLNLKKYIESIPGINVIISEPIMRCDNNALACLEFNISKRSFLFFLKPILPSFCFTINYFFETWQKAHLFFYFFYLFLLFLIFLAFFIFYSFLFSFYSFNTFFFFSFLPQYFQYCGLHFISIFL